MVVLLSTGGATVTDADDNERENDGSAAGDGSRETLLVGWFLYPRSPGSDRNVSELQTFTLACYVWHIQCNVEETILGHGASFAAHICGGLSNRPCLWKQDAASPR